MIRLILLTSILIYACSCTINSKGEADKLPNIVLIMADDMGYGDAGCYNDQSLISTPNIDKLASEGILFTDAHSPAAVCTPSRYGLLTGRYCWRTRVKSGVILGYDETPLIEEERHTLGSLLKESGYETACIGKWHLGLNWQTKNGYEIKDDKNKGQEYEGVFRENEENIDFSKQVNGGPSDLGFDYSFITLGCSTSDPPYVFIENSYPIAIPTEMPPDEYTGLPGFVRGLMDPDWSEEMVDPIFTEKAVNFIENHMTNSSSEPFFLYLALSSPHIPFLVPDFANGKSEEGPRGDLVFVADWCLGEINRILEDYNISDNTLFIFTSDNGPRRGANGHKSAGDLKGYKANIWEGGHRVPFIARWPGQIKAGIKNDAVISLTDIFATLCEIKDTHGISGGEDSYNILKQLKGEIIDIDDENPRIFHSSTGIFALRKGKWKYIEGVENDRNRVIRPDSSDFPGLLFDMSVDPCETNNVADDYPGIIKDMKEKLKVIKSQN